MNQIEIHTTDRTAFKSCRLRWHFTSPLRLNLQPRSANKAFGFGDAWHKALELYYDPQYPTRDIERGKRAFKKMLRKWFFTIPSPSPEQEQEFSNMMQTGLGMLDHYESYARKHDRFNVLWVEQHFIIPIPGYESPVPCPSCDGVGTITPSLDREDDYQKCKMCMGEGKVVPVYSLKTDGAVQDHEGRIWIAEWKTADKMPGDNTEYLLMDDQCGSYLWGVEQATGIRAEGVLYGIAWKKLPTPLAELKDGTLSTDKRVVTTYDYAMRQIIKHHTGEAVPVKYKDFLENLEQQDNRFFYRENVRRNHKEIQILEQHARLEIEEMLDPNLRIYRNPNRFNCSTCAFVGPCLAWYEGADYETMLKGNYVERTR